MSRTPAQVGLVIEWSPRKIVAFDVTSGQTRSFTDSLGLPYAGRTALLAISRRSVFVRATRVPNAAPEDVRMVVQMKLAELFPVPPSDLAFDFQLLPDLNQDGRLALIVAMPVGELRKAREQMAAAGIKVSRVVPVAIGSTHLAETLDFRDAAVVEKTDDLASVDLIAEGLLRYSRVVPPGAPLDVEISRTFNVSGLPCSRIIAAGGAHLDEADASTRSTALESLSGAWLDKIKLNLELPEVIAARELSERRTRQRVAFLLLAAAVVFAGYTFVERSDAQKVVDSQQAGYNTELKKYTNALNLAKADSAKKTNISHTLDVAFGPAQRVSDIALDAAALVPPDVWLTGISIERGKAITIRGTARTNNGVVQYTDNLNKDPRFRNGKLVAATDAEVDKIAVIQFSLSAFPNGNLPIALQQKAGAQSVAQ